MDADERDCFKNDLHVYNTLCDSWEEAIFPGLPGNSSRYGHNSVVDPVDGSLLVFGGYLGALHHDVLKLELGNCSRYGNEVDCVNNSGLCVWTSRTGECVRVGPAVEEGVVYNCAVGRLLCDERVFYSQRIEVFSIYSSGDLGWSYLSFLIQQLLGNQISSPAS